MTTPGYCERCGTHNGKHVAGCTAQAEAMRAVLGECREHFKAQVQADLEFACPIINGVPDESELDSEYVQPVAELRALIAKIDKVLS